MLPRARKKYQAPKNLGRRTELQPGSSRASVDIICAGTDPLREAAMARHWRGCEAPFPSNDYAHRPAASPTSHAQPRIARCSIIDMQREYLEPGGFGECLATMSRSCAGRSSRTASFSRRGAPPVSPVLHTREGHRPDLADLPLSRRSAGRSATSHRRSGPMATSWRAAKRPRHHSSSIPRPAARSSTSR